MAMEKSAKRLTVNRITWIVTNILSFAFLCVLCASAWDNLFSRPLRSSTAQLNRKENTFNPSTIVPTYGAGAPGRGHRDLKNKYLHRFMVQGFTVHSWRMMKIESRRAGAILRSGNWHENRMQNSSGFSASQVTNREPWTVNQSTWVTTNLILNPK